MLTDYDASASVISHLAEALSHKDVTSYFFCRFDDEESLMAKTIIGSKLTYSETITQQPTCRELRIFGPQKDKCHRNGQNLATTLSREHLHFVVLDGLDEYPKAGVDEVVEFLDDLSKFQRLPINVFWSSRPSTPDHCPGKLHANHIISLEDSENQMKVTSDILKLIQATLESWLHGDEPELDIGDPNLILSVRDILAERASGM